VFSLQCFVDKLLQAAGDFETNVFEFDLVGILLLVTVLVAVPTAIDAAAVPEVEPAAGTVLDGEALMMKGLLVLDGVVAGPRGVCVCDGVAAIK